MIYIYKYKYIHKAYSQRCQAKPKNSPSDLTSHAELLKPYLDLSIILSLLLAPLAFRDKKIIICSSASTHDVICEPAESSCEILNSSFFQFEKRACFVVLFNLFEKSCSRSNRAQDPSSLNVKLGTLLVYA